MLITIQQYVRVKGKYPTQILVHKEFESNFVPRKGDFYEDSAFKEPYEFEVESVTVSYQQNNCTVSLKPQILSEGDRNTVEEYVRVMMKYHDWKSVLDLNI